MPAIQGKLIALVLKYGVSYLRKHPEILKHVSDSIPGQLDDLALSVIAKLLGI
ncbi:hypothetical protein PBI_JOSHKAYV_10 [Mycobacterium phage JoshKayV]|uniref:Uncharacterized protein n=1 Tax=Mycobacterium phage JoshKayV TaxID=2024294 RepID=A0A249XTN9_9CAUD|nr:hypothetical protein KIY86_gp97 [Mycobacterium phage JoshKayV]ASZ75350.1 hypothetical protein PBI_JOSHKAYV_10 [Mycobacterium phage JoshKayV]